MKMQFLNDNLQLKVVRIFQYGGPLSFLLQEPCENMVQNLDLRIIHILSDDGQELKFL